MRHFAAVILALAVPGSALAHDFWLQPQSWNVAPSVRTPFTVEVGHGAARERWQAGAERVLALRAIGPGGAADVRPLFVPGGEVPHLAPTFRREGLHVIALVSNNSESNLPAIRFNDFLKEEGLTPAIVHRARTGRTNAPGRELYSRRAKALVRVGRSNPADDALATRPIGLTLEVVPLRNPYSLGTNHVLPVQILFEGRPLPGALVKLTNLEFDSKPFRTMRSDAKGQAQFVVPQSGSWLVNVVWTKPIVSQSGDFQTIFSSLTFGYPVKGRS
jgi:uncharacterized GH25 family protein